MLTKKWLFVDIDDTLCDTKATHLPALKVCFEYLKKCQPQLNYQDFLQAYDKGRKIIHQTLDPTPQSHDRWRYFQEALTKLNIKQTLNLAKKLDSLYWQTVNQKLKLFSGVEKTLKELQKRNIKLGIISDHLRKIQLRKLKTLKIRKYFSVIVISEDTGRDKPDKSIFKLAITKAGIKPKDAVMFGDDYKRDYEGALKNGLLAAHLGSNYHSNNSLKYFSEILKFFPKK